MTLGDAIARYVTFNQSVGMRFQVDAAILTAFHRHAGDVDLTAISPDVVAAFLQPRHRVTSTWLMKHRALRRFYQSAIARGLVARSPVPTVVPRVSEIFVPHIYSDKELRRLLTGIEANQADTRCTIAAPTFRAFLLLLYGAGRVRRRSARLPGGRCARVLREPTRRPDAASDGVVELRGPPHEGGGVRPSARLAAYLCRALPARLVPGRRRCPASRAAPLDLPGPRPDGGDPTLSHDDSGTLRPGQPTI